MDERYSYIVFPQLVWLGSYDMERCRYQVEVGRRPRKMRLNKTMVQAACINLALAGSPDCAVRDWQCWDIHRQIWTSAQTPMKGGCSCRLISRQHNYEPQSRSGTHKQLFVAAYLHTLISCNRPGHLEITRGALPLVPNYDLTMHDRDGSANLSCFMCLSWGLLTVP